MLSEIKDQLTRLLRFSREVIAVDKELQDELKKVLEEGDPECPDEDGAGDGANHDDRIPAQR